MKLIKSLGRPLCDDYHTFFPALKVSLIIYMIYNVLHVVDSRGALVPVRPHQNTSHLVSTPAQSSVKSSSRIYQWKSQCRLRQSLIFNLNIMRNSVFEPSQFVTKFPFPDTQ